MCFAAKKFLCTRRKQFWEPCRKLFVKSPSFFNQSLLKFTDFFSQTIPLDSWKAVLTNMEKPFRQGPILFSIKVKSTCKIYIRSKKNNFAPGQMKGNFDEAAECCRRYSDIIHT